VKPSLTQTGSTQELTIELGPLPGAVTLILNRPQRKNALTRNLVLGLGAALRKFSADPEVRVLIVRGAGGAFCSGADLNTIVSAERDEVPARIDEFHQLITNIVEAPQPVIAVVDGPAVGFGADLALSCDARLFTDAGYVEEGFIKVGLMPDGGGTYFMQRFGGMRAFEYLALGTRLDAQRCAELGIANRLVGADSLEDELLGWVQSLTQAAPLALRHIKAAVRAHDRQLLAQTLAIEKRGQTELVLSEDFQEGVRAFLEKRTPHFQGK